MKVINIFVASSIVAFSRERKRLAAYFCDLNNTVIESGLFFNVKFCEELDNAVPETRKQNEYNALIEHSDLVLFLVASDCGDYTFEEFRVALHSVNKPRIVVLSQNIENGLSSKVLFMKEQAAESRVQYIPFNGYDQLEVQVKNLAQSLLENILLKETPHTADIKKISFFLGVSGIESDDEKNEILRFVLGLNDKLLSKKIYVQLVPCIENELNDDVQQKHKNLIRSSDAAFFVFFSSIDSLTEQDLHFAVSQFKKNGSPKIYTYFRDQSEDEDSVHRIKEYIDQKLNHYYSIFSSVDSIKLSILLRLYEHNLAVLSIENGTIMYNKMSLLDVNGLRIFSQNKILDQYKRRLADLTGQYDTAAEEFSSDRNRRDLLKRLSDLDDEITGLKETIRREENEALTMLCQMHRNVAKGEMNALMKKAYRLLEKGMIVEAAEILNKDTVDSYYGDRLTDQISTLRSEVDDAIEMYRHTIHIQKMLVETETTVNTIIACYDRIMQYIPMAEPNTYTLVLEYAQYLDCQNNPAAEPVFAKAEYLLNDPEHKASPEILVHLYRSMGDYYRKQHHSELSEKYLEKYYLIAQDLYRCDEVKYAVLYSKACFEYAQNDSLNKIEILEHGLTIMKENFDVADPMAQSIFAPDMAYFYYMRGNFFGCIYDYYYNLVELHGASAEILTEQNFSAWNRKSTTQKFDEATLNLLKKYHKQSGFRANDYCDIAIKSYQAAAELLEQYHIQDGKLADIYNGMAEIIRKNDRGKTSERTVMRYFDQAQIILEGLYAAEPDVYADALGTIYNNKCISYLHYGERYYQGLQCLKASEEVYTYLYQRNPRKNGLGLAECYIQLSYVYDSLKNKKRALAYAHKGVELLEKLVEINYDRYANKLAWAYSELGLLYSLYDEHISTSDYLCKSLDVLEAAKHADFQQSQFEIISKIMVAIQLMIKQKNGSSNDAVYDLGDRLFKFTYTYVKPHFDNKPEFSSMLYSLGETLLYHFDSVDHEKTMQFYYPAVMELGEEKLEDPSVPDEEKMFINFTLASIATLSGDTEKGESFFQAHLNSFVKTYENKEQNIKKKKAQKKKSKKSKKKK